MADSSKTSGTETFCAVSNKELRSRLPASRVAKRKVFAAMEFSGDVYLVFLS
jgi:hypothetical protein